MTLIPSPFAFSEYFPSLHNASSDTHTLSEIRYRLSRHSPAERFTVLQITVAHNKLTSLSFIEEHDLSGKQIYLFCSHGTGGLAKSVQDITAVLPDTAIISENVFYVYQDGTIFAQEDLQNWLKALQ